MPTSELIGYSVRGGALGKEFVTSYSMPPEYLAQFVFPFAPGEPAEGNEEYRAYFGIAPLLLALSALIARRSRQTIFFAAFALVALSLALGELNPLYQLLYRLPLFNSFRVPARYLYLFVFAAAFLSAVALDVIASGAKQSPTRDVEIASSHPSTPLRMLLAMTRNALASLMIGAIALTHTQSLAFWLDAWRVLPILLAIATIGTLALAATRKIARGVFVVAILGLTIFDLICHAPPFLKTIDALTPTAGVTALPRSVQALGDALTRGRVWTDDSIFPSPPAMRNSLFPNTALLYDKPSAQIYSSLAFGRHQAYVYNMSPAMLDLLNVRYVMMPLEPRPPSALPADSLGAIILRDEITFAPIETRALEIVSATEQANSFADGARIAEIVLRFADGATQMLPIRAGIETADWDVARKQSSPRVPIARTFPAYWRAFGRAFDGYVYSARYEFASPRKIVSARVRVLEPGARLLIESIAFETRDKTISLARLIGKNEFVLAYLSDTVAAWENRDALPRTFIVHRAQVLDDDAAFARLHDPGFDPAREVLLAEDSAVETAPTKSQSRPPSADQSAKADLAQSLPRLESPGTVAITKYQPERVEIKATTDQPGYLVLADSWYPGWNAFVDGQPAPIYRADVLFRAVRIEPGTHDIVFEYRPLSFALGALISTVSLLIVFGISVWYFRFGKGQ
ncbi:MAG: YfhO family protein [Anaerolineales bacterium]|nr:YfhO family protein [Anaerolineales bacterium]